MPRLLKAAMSVLVCLMMSPLAAGLKEVNQQYTEMESAYAQLVQAQGEMSEAAHAARSSLIDAYWEDREFIKPLPLLRKSLAYLEQKDIKGPERGRVRWRLGKCLAVAGNHDEALPLLEETFAKRSEKFGVDDRKTIAAAIELGKTLYFLGLPERAIPLLEDAVKYSAQAWGEQHGKYAYAQMHLGSAYIAANRLDEALTHLREAYQIFDLRMGTTSRQTNLVRLSLAEAHRRAGRLDKAEKILRKAFSDFISKKGNETHQLTYALMSKLGQVLTAQGRYQEAEVLLVRSTELRKQHLGPDSLKTLRSMLTLATIYIEQKKGPEAEAVIRDALSHMQGKYGDDSRLGAQTNLLLARALVQQKKYDGAGQAYKKVGDYLATHATEANLSQGYKTGWGRLALLNGDADTAVTYLEEAVAIAVASRGEQHPKTTKVMTYLAEAYEKQGKYEEAVTTYRRAMAGSSGFLAARETFSQTGRLQQEASAQRYLISFMDLMVNAYQQHKKVGAEPVSESFSIAENARSRTLQQSMLGMTARAAARNQYLSELVRREQDIRLQLGVIEEQLIEAVTQGGTGDNKQGKRVEQQRRELQHELNKIGHEMSYQYPEYSRLMNPPPTEIGNVQALLAPGELMLAYYAQKDRTLLWSIDKQTTQLHVIPLGQAQLFARVQKIRTSLDVPIATLEDIPAYDTKLAYDLYQALIAPAGRQLETAKNLIIVPHGALLSLPFGALVTEAGNPAQQGLPFAEYRSVAWLAVKQAVNIMPSATAFVTMRKYAKHEPADNPFIGFGDPVFGSDSTQPSAKVATRGLRVAQRAAINTRNLKSLPNLPETRDELKKIALTLGSADDSLFLGKRATESNVRKASLKDFRVVAFATHGLVAGDLDGLDQPALALTIPDEATEGDDGLLQMGEVLGLELNADWVVLSACNTAAGDKSLANEGLTGLTQAFFYAGSRALLVSLWPVESTSTQLLTTSMFEAAKNNPALGRAASLQQARLRLINGQGYVQDGKEVFSYAHPIFWSAFIAVGEGGVN